MYVDATGVSVFAKKLGEAAGMVFKEKPSLFETFRRYVSAMHRVVNHLCSLISNDKED